jgi:hypothetical protein
VAEALSHEERKTLFEDMQRNVRRFPAEQIAAELGFSRELTDRAEAIRRDILSLESEADVNGLVVVGDAIVEYWNDVRRELCSRSGADCEGYEIGLPIGEGYCRDVTGRPRVFQLLFLLHAWG